MSGEDLKKLNDRFNDEVYRRRNIDAIDELLSEDFVEHTPAPGQAADRKGAKDSVEQMLQAFPDLEYEIESQIAEGDTVAVVGRMSGTHRGEYAGVPATGRRVSFEVMDTARVRNGRYSEHWGLGDMAGLMTQLGVATGA